MRAFNPSYLREFFTNQAHEFLVLANVAEDYLGVHGYRVAIFDSRRVGRDPTCPGDSDPPSGSGQRSPVYIDLEEIGSALEPSRTVRRAAPAIGSGPRERVPANTASLPIEYWRRTQPKHPWVLARPAA